MQSERKKAQARRIMELKEALGAEILSHFYQRGEVKALSDYVGGTRGILKKARKSNAKALVVCAVGFVSEAAKRMRPDIPVLVPRSDALCPFGESMGPEEISSIRKKHPEAFLVASLKASETARALCDGFEALSEDGRLISPEIPPGMKKALIPSLRGLPEWEPAAACGGGEGPFFGEGPFPEASGAFKKGLPCCQIHAQIEAREVLELKARMPGALVAANALSAPEVIRLSDYAGDADGIYFFCSESLAKNRASEFIVIAEEGLVQSLSSDFPGKGFRGPETEMFCPNMKLTNIKDIARAMEGHFASPSEFFERGALPKEGTNDLFG